MKTRVRIGRTYGPQDNLSQARVFGDARRFYKESSEAVFYANLGTAEGRVPSIVPISMRRVSHIDGEVHRLAESG
jgi:hypothetical protein